MTCTTICIRIIQMKIVCDLRIIKACIVTDLVQCIECFYFVEGVILRNDEIILNNLKWHAHQKPLRTFKILIRCYGSSHTLMSLLSSSQTPHLMVYRKWKRVSTVNLIEFHPSKRVAIQNRIESRGTPWLWHFVMPTPTHPLFEVSNPIIRNTRQNLLAWFSCIFDWLPRRFHSMPYTYLCIILAKTSVKGQRK